MKKVYSLWKTPFLPIKLQNLHLHIINHKLKLNNQLKHFARDENKHLVSGKCTFCTINNISNHSEESYTHLFLECGSSMSALTPIAIRYNIELPDMEKEGEKVLYFYKQEEINSF